MKHQALLKRENACLIIIDMQEKLLAQIPKREEIVKNVSTLIKFAGIVDIPIILTEHYPKGLGPTVNEIRDVLPGYAPIIKTIFGCFGVEEFRDRLKEFRIESLIVTGIETHICVEQTVLDAIADNYKVHLIADGVGSRSKENHELGIEKMRQFGAVISSTEMAMYEIVERADAPEFKEFLKLVK